MKEEMIDISDENVIKIVPRSEIKPAMLHRGVFVGVINSKNELIIHKRSMTKQFAPGQWELVFGGFCSSGESYEEAAKRELKEESGIVASELVRVAKFDHKSSEDNFFAEFFLCHSDDKIKPLEGEVDEIKAVPLNEVDEFIKDHDIKLTASLIWNKYKDKIK